MGPLRIPPLWSLEEPLRREQEAFAKQESQWADEGDYFTFRRPHELGLRDPSNQNRNVRRYVQRSGETWECAPCQPIHKWHDDEEVLQKIAKKRTTAGMAAGRASSASRATTSRQNKPTNQTTGSTGSPRAPRAAKRSQDEQATPKTEAGATRCLEHNNGLQNSNVSNESVTSGKAKPEASVLLGNSEMPSLFVGQHTVTEASSSHPEPHGLKRRGTKRKVIDDTEDAKHVKKRATENKQTKLDAREGHDDDAQGVVPIVSPKLPPKTTKGRGGRARDGNQTVTKPVRITRACDMCRLKKTKCDGERPCGACGKRDFICSYDGSQTRSGTQASTKTGKEGGKMDAEAAAAQAGGASSQQAESDTKQSREERTKRTNLTQGSSSSPKFAATDLIKPTQRKRKREKATGENEDDDGANDNFNPVNKRQSHSARL